MRTRRRLTCSQLGGQHAADDVRDAGGIGGLALAGPVTPFHVPVVVDDHLAVGTVLTYTIVAGDRQSPGASRRRTANPETASGQRCRQPPQQFFCLVGHTRHPPIHLPGVWDLSHRSTRRFCVSENAKGQAVTTTKAEPGGFYAFPCVTADRHSARISLPG